MNGQKRGNKIKSNKIFHVAQRDKRGKESNNQFEQLNAEYLPMAPCILWHLSAWKHELYLVGKGFFHEHPTTQQYKNESIKVVGQLQ